MDMKVFIQWLTAMTLIFLAGCMTASDSSELPATHPASAQAEHSRNAPMQRTLMTGSEGLVRPASTNDAGLHDEHDHASHIKPTAKPAEHEHGKDHPKEKGKK